tara:strand:+ start:745 stop:1425 length:681 start_codon:yes stop_codon:yes gene_type:complete
VLNRKIIANSHATSHIQNRSTPLKKTKDILIIIFAIVVVSSVAFVIIGILVIQDKYKGEPQASEFIQEKQNSLTSISNTIQRDSIEAKARKIEYDPTLVKKEFDLMELTGVVTDGGRILQVWLNKNQISKIYEEIGLSYGRVATTIYVDNGSPIKIIETEENFGHDNGELNFEELNQVFKATIYVLDWENNNTKIERIGKRVLSEDSFSTFDYEPIIERARKAILK